MTRAVSQSSGIGSLHATHRLAGCVLSIALTVFATGCGSKEAEPPGGTTPSPTGQCQVTITGAVTTSFTSPGGYDAVATDYWLSDAETRALLEVIADDPEDPHFTDRDTEIEQGMLRDPRFITLGLFCRSSDAGVMLLPGLHSAYFNVPFGPHTYEIAPGAEVTDVIPGNFAAIVNLVEAGQPARYVVAEPGELTISIFNRSRIAGAFSFPAASGGSKIEVRGQFDFRKPILPQQPATGR